MKQFLFFFIVLPLSICLHAQNDFTFSLQKDITVSKDLLIESTEKNDAPIPITVEMKRLKDDLIEISFISATKVDPYNKLYFFNAENDYKNLIIAYPTIWAPKKFTKSLQNKKIQQFDVPNGATRMEKETKTMFVGDDKATFRYTISPSEANYLFKFKFYVSSNTPKGNKFDTKMEFESKFLPLIVQLESECDKYNDRISELTRKVEALDKLRSKYERFRTESNYNELIAYKKESIEGNNNCNELKELVLLHNALLNNIPFPDPPQVDEQPVAATPVSKGNNAANDSGGIVPEYMPSHCDALEQTLKVCIQELESLRKASRRGEDIKGRLDNVRNKYETAFQAAEGDCKRKCQKSYNSCQEGYNYLKKR
jgi:hypothetical protein